MLSSLTVVAALGLTAVPSAAWQSPPLGLDLYRPVPDDNPLTPGKIALGRQLFHERQLSRDGSLSCASCHDPTRAFSGGLPVARGIGGAAGTRNAPPLVNRAWGTSFFWDGRAITLEQQVLEPILNPAELGMAADGVMRLARSDRYRQRFRTAFGTEASLTDVARALASYVRTIVSGDAPYDRYTAGDPTAIGDSARRGLGLFGGKAGCGTCHSGPLFSDERFHNTGVAWRSGVLTDEGRSKVTGVMTDRGAFKTPTLREVARTAPYMHDGSVPTLAEVVEFYDKGGHANRALDPRIRPLGLTSTEKQDLLSFLSTLSGRIVDSR